VERKATPLSGRLLVIGTISLIFASVIENAHIDVNPVRMLRAFLSSGRKANVAGR
jgi:hypothetical protein